MGINLGVLGKKNNGSTFLIDSTKVKLMLRGDADLNDSSPDNVSMTATGNVSISTTDAKYGVGKIQFGESPKDGKLRTTNSFFNFGNKRPFTLSMWAKGGDNNGGFATTREAGIFTPFDLKRNTVLIGNSALNDWIFSTFNVSSFANWFHIALVADGANLKGYLDGVLKFTVSHPNWPSANSFLVFGRNGDGVYTNGAYDDILLYDGVLWTSGFTPPNEIVF